MATEKAETDRVPVTLALSTITYLEKLVRQGTHGTSVPGVARTLIEEGIRLAIKDGLLSIRDNGKTSDGIWKRGGSQELGPHHVCQCTDLDHRPPRTIEESFCRRPLLPRDRGQIGVTRNAVIGKLSRLGLTRGPARANRARRRLRGNAADGRFRACSMTCCTRSMNEAPLQEEASSASTAARCSNSPRNAAAGRSLDGRRGIRVLRQHADRGHALLRRAYRLA